MKISQDFVMADFVSATQTKCVQYTVLIDKYVQRKTYHHTRLPHTPPPHVSSRAQLHRRLGILCLKRCQRLLIGDSNVVMKPLPLLLDTCRH